MQARDTRNSERVELQRDSFEDGPWTCASLSVPMNQICRYVGGERTRPGSMGHPPESITCVYNETPAEGSPWRGSLRKWGSRSVILRGQEPTHSRARAESPSRGSLTRRITSKSHL